MVRVAQETESVTLRRLPDGAQVRGPLERRQQEPLRVVVGTDGSAADFPVGAPVEVGCDRVLYLGEVVAVQGSSIVVDVKHALDRAALAAIQDVWQNAPGVRRPS